MILLSSYIRNASGGKGADTPWVTHSVTQIASRFEQQTGPEFPCVFAQNAYQRGNILFLPVPYQSDVGTYQFSALAEGLKTYLKSEADWDGSVNTTRPLLVLFEPVPHLSATKDYEKTFIDALQYLIDHDSVPWVNGTPKQPEQEYWSMCFEGQQLFINVSHPNNVNRRSRNLCDAMVLVINPRERFDIVAGVHKKGYSVREKIRQNIDRYDLISHSPLLGHYQAGGLEWPQYMLPDHNDAPPMKCPLKFR